MADLRAATNHLLDLLRSKETDAALAGATPYLRLFALAAGGVWLAKGALEGASEERIALCRFVAENLVPETGSLRHKVVAGAASLAAAHDLLIKEAV